MIRRYPLTDKDLTILSMALGQFISRTETIIKDIESVLGAGNITLTIQGDLIHAKTLKRKLGV